MKKVVLISFLVLSIVSCKKESGVMMKYAYITQDNLDYKTEHGYEVVTTHLCPFDHLLTSDEVNQEQERQKLLSEDNGKKILADTLVGMDENVTKLLFNKLKR